MRLTALCLVLLLLASHAHASAGERMETTARLLDDGRAHVTMMSMNPMNFADLEGIINEPKVKSIYQGRLSRVFEDVDGLRLYTRDRSVVIEFDCRLGEKKDGVWAVGRVDFKGLVQPASVLRIELPEGTKMLGADPSPSEMQDGHPTWDDIDFIPHVEYAEEGKGSLFKYGLVILLVFIVLLLKKKRLGD